MSLELSEKVKIAYKKLKAGVYFDKTQLPLRDMIVAYEGGDVDKQLGLIAKKLESGEAEWNAYSVELLNQVSAYLYPKALGELPKDMVIINSSSAPIQMGKPQYFIDLPVAGHILGTLWVLSVGLELDKGCDGTSEGMYEHSYGNRIKKNIINEQSGEITYSPYLFEPYFAQYTGWRDRALEQAKERLADQQDAVILTLDFTRFFYSVDMKEEHFSSFLARFEKPAPWIKRVNVFVYQVLRGYSEFLRPFCEGTEFDIADRTILPIGFAPSNILSNWVLTGFDNAVIEQWNPVYYGRYVDDAIIVDKVENNSKLYKMARAKTGGCDLNADAVIKSFLIDRETPILEVYKKNVDKAGKEVITYKLNETLLGAPSSLICVQNSKVKVFYFQSGSTQALLDCFKTKIARNVSEFRMMPDLDPVLLEKDYSEIFELKCSDSINKLRGIDGISIDKYGLAKFLGKYRKVCGLINDKKEENAFEKDLMVILDERLLIENYNAWERILEILVVNDRMELLEECCLRILSAIRRYEIPDKIVKASGFFARDGLLLVLRSALCRVSALTWGAKIDQVIEKVYKQIQGVFADSLCSKRVNDRFEPGNMRCDRLEYCRSRMVNKYVLPLPIDCILKQLTAEEHPQVRLCELSESAAMLDPNWVKDDSFRYYPYMFTPQEISFALLYTSLCNDKLCRPEEYESDLKAVFLSRNFPNICNDDKDVYGLSDLKVLPFGKRNAAIQVGSPLTQKGKLRVAIGNAELEMRNFEAALDRRPNRSYKRYRYLSKILDDALEQGAELLVLPENYLPIEWLPTVSRFCANNQIALITGIEHIPVGDVAKGNAAVYNLTAVILPYESQHQKFAHVTCHSKVHFSPEEKRLIEGHYFNCRKGECYELFCWRGIWFPVYCCFELASINDRALFRFYADMAVAVEWNTDIPYFSSIIESMCRDLHCYCIQANSSGPGDSRVLQPTRSETRDIIKTKGGDNPCILVAEIDIEALREFQTLGYTLQKDKKTFKPSPPDLDQALLKAKRDGTLLDFIKENDKYTP